MRHPRYMTPEAVEIMRQQAIGLRGVSYDSRSNRYVADIMISGKRRRIGSFYNALEASEAYEAARKENPAKGPFGHVQGKATVQRSYAEFIARNPEVRAGLVWTTPDGQRFVFHSRKNTGFYLFTSHCRNCGEGFETSVSVSPDIMAGVTRNCPKHRKASPFLHGAKVEQALSSIPQGPEFTDDDAGLAELPLMTEGEHLARIQARAKREGREVPAQMTQGMLDALSQVNARRLAARAKRDARKAWETAQMLGVADLV